MKKLFILGLGLLLISAAVEANAPNSQKHTVKMGETLSSISRAAGVKLNDVLNANPGLHANSKIRVGQQLNIPSKYNVQNSQVAVKASNKVYEAQMNAIKRSPTSVPGTPNTPYSDEDITQNSASIHNGLTTANSENHCIANEFERNAAKSTFNATTNSNNPEDMAALFKDYCTHGYRVVRNRGIGTYLEGSATGGTYSALYEGAEPGTVIKVTNLMNHKEIYVKVTGKVRDTDASKNVILKLSRSAAQELGAGDKKFLVEIAGVVND